MRREVDPALIPPAVLRICKRLAEEGERAFIVGGCLRDLLREKPISDWDVATTARPEKVQKIFRRVIPTGLQHGTVTVLEGGIGYEVTTLRGEGAYSDGRRPDEVFFVDAIEDDLARRDFTVNAIAFDPATNALIDPFGGLADLERGVLRAVGDPAERFNEDGLRILRAARFVATLEFELDPATEAAISGAIKTYAKVSRERVQAEWLKTMKAARPSRAFAVMQRTGILKATFPELDETTACPLDPSSSGPHDAFALSLAALDAASGATERMAALLLQIGRPKTRATGYDHYDRMGADVADRWLRDYRYSNEERAAIVHAIRHQRVPLSRELPDADVYRFMRRVGVDRLDALFRVRRGLLRGAEAIGLVTYDGSPVADLSRELDLLEERTSRACTDRVPLSTKELAIDGQDVMQHLSIAPSRAVGELLEAVLEHVLEHPSERDRDAQLAALERIWAKR
jgi:tRNA nucleotidyltransferase (CCA-adding enzyme)